MISGKATVEGTLNFAKKNSNEFLFNYKKINGLTLSNVGMGTYLGDANSVTDDLVKSAVKNSILSGINVVDTAINYRAQKAERSVGSAINELIQEDKLSRDEIFVSTKNGYVTNDADIQEDFWSYVNREYVQTGVIQQNDISPGYHCMTISYLEDQLNRSLKNLNLECVDLMYLHNAVEGQINNLSQEQFIKNLKSAFEFYESQRKEGKINYYGMATWECFRVTPDNPQFLSISKVIDLAKQVGGDNHGFRFIQLPFNLYLDQAMMIRNQIINDQSVSILAASKLLELGVFTSVPFMQGRLLSPGVMPEFNELSPPLRALQFIRSTPGVLAPLVGQKTNEHVKQNLEIMEIKPISENDHQQLVQTLTSGNST